MGIEAEVEEFNLMFGERLATVKDAKFLIENDYAAYLYLVAMEDEFPEWVLRQLIKMDKNRNPTVQELMEELLTGVW